MQTFERGTAAVPTSPFYTERNVTTYGPDTLLPVSLTTNAPCPNTLYPPITYTYSILPGG